MSGECDICGEHAIDCTCTKDRYELSHDDLYYSMVAIVGLDKTKQIIKYAHTVKYTRQHVEKICKEYT